MSRRRHAIRGEDGFTIVAALAVLLLLLLLSAAAMTGTLSATGGASRAKNDAKAIEAAEAAASLGASRLSLAKIDGIVVTNPTTPCLSLNVSGNLALAAYSTTVGSLGWCPSVAVSVPGATSASYRASGATLNLGTNTRYVIGSATVGGVTRRVRLSITSTVGTGGAATDVFGTYAVVSDNDLSMQNQTQVVGGGVRSNGNILLQDTAVPCHVSGGAITPGVGKTYTSVNNASACGNSTASATSVATFPAITVPGTNDNAGITSGTDVSWNATTKRLILQNSGAITLTGNVYNLCQLDLKASSTVTVNPTNDQPVKFYFPSTCTDTTNLFFENSSQLINLTGLGAKGIQFYIQGSSATAAIVDNASLITAMIYAPTATVQIINSGSVKGGVAADSVLMTANGKVTYDSSIVNVVTSGGTTTTYSSYGESNFAQCTASSGTTDPSNGC